MHSSHTIDLADRVEVNFACDSGHEFLRSFAADVRPPKSWDCPHCGKTATRGSHRAPHEVRPTNKTHWDMILERRSENELATMLSTRLGELRSPTDQPSHP